MNTGQKIKEGDWFCAIEGLAIADKIFYFYFEEFDKIPQGKKSGRLQDVCCAISVVL